MAELMRAAYGGVSIYGSSAAGLLFAIQPRLYIISVYRQFFFHTPSGPSTKLSIVVLTAMEPSFG